MSKAISAYYNEFDPKAAAWLRQLIKNGNITPGEVDERSITEVTTDDLVGFDRVHFFAGIGTWDYCLNESGWGDKPIWTASLPCQPFSAAGKGLGKEDERHLLPHFLELVRQCKPYTIFGEQVERAIAHGWLDDLQAAMEAEDYAIGHCVLGAHSIGAPHIRQRLYWVANSHEQRLQGRQGAGCPDKFSFGQSCVANGMGVSDSAGSQQRIETTERARHWHSIESAGGDDIQWIYCRDNKYRPIKPGSIKMATGFTGRVVCCGHTSIEKNEYSEEEKVNGTENKTNSREILPSVRQEDGKEEVRQNAGGLDRIQKQEILRSTVHGESLRGCDESHKLKKCPQAISEGSEGVLRGVFKDNHSSCSSCGRKSFEQRTIEFDDIVRDMPQGSTFAQLLGSEGAQYMQTLRKTGDEDRPLLDAQHQAKEVWKSLNDEEKDRIRIHFNNRAWVMDEAIKPLVDGTARGMVHSSDTSAPISANATQEARMMRLKGYGNAIQAQVAIAFINAFLDAIGVYK